MSAFNLNTASSALHERNIPPLSSLCNTTTTHDYNSSLSFCTPTSLAFAKRLTWEQTPWIPVSGPYKPVNPISAADADLISQHLASHTGRKVSAEAVQRALLFGSTYPSHQHDTDTPTPTPTSTTTTGSNGGHTGTLPTAALGHYPHLFIIFPSARTSPSTDEQFLRIWHDDIVKPAFDAAWRHSTATHVYGAHANSAYGMLPPTALSTAHDAQPASGFLQRLRNKRVECIRTYWPCWTDTVFPTGTEGRFSGLRADIYAEAWDAMLGMLKEHPQLAAAGYQDPVLLAVARGTVHVNERFNAGDRVRAVAQEWDGFVDARFVAPASFRVVFEVVAGVEDGVVVVGGMGMGMGMGGMGVKKKEEN